MSSDKKYRSQPLKSLHKVAEDLHAVGAIDNAAMKRFDTTCLTQRGPFSESRMTHDQLLEAVEWIMREGSDKGPDFAFALGPYYPGGPREYADVRSAQRWLSGARQIPLWAAMAVCQLLRLRGQQEAIALAEEIEAGL